MMSTSLNGLRVLNTRPAHQAAELCARIRQAGGVAIECPTLEIVATRSDWLDDLPDLHEVSYAIFISANAVHYCFKILNPHHWPDTIKVIAIGKGSSKALQTYQIPVDAQPKQADSEHLLKLPCLQAIDGQTVLLFKGTRGRTLIQDELLTRGAKLSVLSVYDSRMPKPNLAVVSALAHDNAIDVILITSEQSLQNLFQMVPASTHNDLQQKTCIVISERLSKIAMSLGMQHIIVSSPDKMIEALLHLSQGIVHG